MRVLRAAALGLGSLVAARLLAGWAAELAAQGPGGVDDVVALGAAAAGALVATWYTLTAAVLALAELAALTRATPRAAAFLRAAVARFGAPVLRHAAVVGVGAGLALGTAPAVAGQPASPHLTTGPLAAGAAASQPEDAAPFDLRPGLGSVTVPTPEPQPSRAALVDTATEPQPSATPAVDIPTESQPPEATPASATTEAPATVHSARGPAPGSANATSANAAQTDPAPAEDPAAEAYTVRRGDSLWSIAAAHLGPAATDPEIAAAWPQWHTTNRAVIGADPHLIHPGQVLLAPDSKETP